MELKTLMKIVGPIIVLSLILPTADIVSDLLTVIKLYVGAYGCKVSDLAREHYAYDYRVCENNPVEYCTTNDKHQHYWRASACLVSVVRK